MRSVVGLGAEGNCLPKVVQKNIWGVSFTP